MTRCSKPSQDTPDSRADDRSPISLQNIFSPTAVINRAALRGNLALLKAHNPQAQTLITVKANAYGHGLYEIADTLQHEVHYIGVARVEEGRKLREHGVSSRIVVLSDRLGTHNIQTYYDADLTPCLFDDADLEQQLKLVEDKSLPFWLKVNTGMNRLGVSPLNIERLRECFSTEGAARKIKPEVLLTHFSTAEESDETKLQQQLALFEALCEALPLPGDCKISLANSAASLKNKDAPIGLQSHQRINRLGLALYGLTYGNADTSINDNNNNDTRKKTNEHVSDEASSNHLQENLTQVMSLYAPVLSVQRLRPGETVGYNDRWRAEKESVIATVGIGYGDGYPRHAAPGTPVYFGAEAAPLAGTVSMDMIGVDITELAQREDIQPGSVACLWGNTLCSARPFESGQDIEISNKLFCLNTLASHCSTISYQLLTGVSQRVNRVYID